MQPATNSLMNATRKAAKFLQRDFFELESLQNSTRGTVEFCNKSVGRTKTILQDELQKHSKFILSADEKAPLPTNADIVLLINPIEGLSNLIKSLPFFAISVVYLKKINSVLTPVSTVISFPALGETYYAEKGGGAWLDKITGSSSDKSMRLRSSSCNSLDNAYIGSDDIDSGSKISKNLRYFGSSCYNLALFASGKLDILHANSLNYTLKPAFELIIREAGGFIIEQDGQFIATNNNLAEKIKG